MRPEERHWDIEIARIAENLPKVFAQKPDAVVGVAVDDANKRDYFAPRLQRILNEQKSPGVVRLIPMNGEPVVFLRAKPPADSGAAGEVP